MEIDAAKTDKEYMNCCANNIETLVRMLNGIGKKYSESVLNILIHER